VLVGSQSFFDRREVRDLMAYLKAIAFPRDEISLLRIINVPARGVSQSAVQKISTRAVQQGCSFWEAVEAAREAGEITARSAEGALRFRGLLEKYRVLFRDQPDRLGPLVAQLIEEIGYEDEIRKQYKDEAQQLARKEVLDGFVASLGEYASRADRPSLHEFIEQTALSDRSDETDKDDQLASHGVKLMTLHSAKGLEFPWVYLVGLEEGLLPHKRSVEDGSRKAIEEERRLAYVGITRAKDFLTISRAKTRTKWGKKRLTVPSRFLHEMQGIPQASEDDAEQPAAGSHADGE
jgi:DNA helicase II / ATP-dependent DNA helicase PcrA